MDDAAPPRRPRMTRPDRRAEIARAATECLKRDGYAALTARKVAEAAALSLGHLTYSFADMDELLSETYRLASEELRHTTEVGLEGAGQDPWARLESFLRAGYAPEILDPGYLRMRVDLWSAALTHPKIAETERALYDRYRLALEGHLRAAGPRTGITAVRALADAVMALLDGLWLDFIRRGDLDAVENGIDACLDLARARLVLG
jgi:TetR/AcrR family transcriptional regulator, transcriptional repressor of bet genes